MNLRAYYFLAVGLLYFGIMFVAEANVFVSDIRVGAGTNNGYMVHGGEIGISYILNEPATRGVEITLFNGTTLIRRFCLAADTPGTLRGMNRVFWNGTNDQGVFAGTGLYSIRVTASSVGYTNWTQISDDSNLGNQVSDPYGIAVNRDTNSPYYGRVFVGNASTFESQGKAGIYLYNADGSPADEGEYSNGGYWWSGRMLSPFKMAVSQDDDFYVLDWSSSGVVLGFNQAVDHFNYVLQSSNWLHIDGGFINLSGLSVTGTGANKQLWMCDWGEGYKRSGLGIFRWNIGSGAAVSNDVGSLVVASGEGSDLSEGVFDLDVDKNGAIYAVQLISSSDNPAFRVLRFSLPSDGSLPVTNADWKTGIAGENYTNEYGDTYNIFGNSYAIAVDGSASNVAVAVLGDMRSNGGLIVLDANTGEIRAQVDASYESSYMDVVWDAVGNLYGSQRDVWRVFSPPGTNQSTTVAAVGIQVLDSVTPPLMSAPRWKDGAFEFDLNGQPAVPYLIELSSDLMNWSVLSTNFGSSASRVFTTKPSDDLESPDVPMFYRAVAQ
jgi:hypothetical protein